jgi:hypothetical protein
MICEHKSAVSARPSCGHAQHVGTCGACQRAQLARWRLQLMQVTRAQVVSGSSLHPSSYEWNGTEEAATGIVRCI